MNDRVGRVLNLIKRASRSQFDLAAPAIGAARSTFDRLSAELAEAEAELAQLRAEVAAYRASTSWQLTRPLRWMAGSLRSRSSPDAALASSGLAVSQPPTYHDWIARSERSLLDRLMPPEPPGGLAVIELRPDRSATDLVHAALASGSSHVCFHDPRDVMAPDAVAIMSHAAARDPDLDVIFADEDWLDADGRRARPFLKPGWNPELQRGRDLLGPFTFLRTRLLASTSPTEGPGWRYDLANQIVAGAARIHHVPAVLCHRTVSSDAAALREAAAADLRRRGVDATVEPAEEGVGWRVVYRLSDPPTVSIVVPTRDRADLLRVAADMVLSRTDYPAIELVLMDNGSAHPDALDLLAEVAADARVRLLRQDAPFNWSALCNAGVAAARGEVIVLLNNDVAALRSDWLTELVTHAMQPGVGAAGAKLLYPDGTVQHAGLTTDARGIGRHLLRHSAGDVAGPFGLLALARDVWGVTGACMAVRRDVFLAVGGLNEALPVTCNDVDFCLRLAAAGYRIVWTPWSVVQHRELASRPSDEHRQAQAAAERTRLQRDWGSLVQYDPYLHPALELVGDELRWRI